MGLYRKKAKRVRQDDPDEYGDIWLHVAISATQKAVIAATWSASATARSPSIGA